MGNECSVSRIVKELIVGRLLGPETMEFAEDSNWLSTEISDSGVFGKNLF
jgi:hypothetical protein